ncbi:hypothetical protein PG275_01030 [Riemerella anatipestifer]|uniref:hypothetical protein n=1 Tax=Riemerella anatipestifer TaxID=34085 RepID=UPI002A89520A|nr:hypothetical protein [Riemerella anatipestifer]
MNTIQALKKIIESENGNNLSEFTVLGMPVWRLVRFSFRVQALNKASGFKNKSENKSGGVFEIVKGYFLSLFQIIRYVFFVKKNKDLAIFTFPRLSFIDGHFFDKFTDPIIENTHLENYVIFQRTVYGKDKKCRVNNNKIIYTDFINISAIVCSYLFFPFITMSFFKKIKLLSQKCSIIYDIEFSKVHSDIVKSIGKYIFQSLFYELIYNRFGLNTIIVVSREVFLTESFIAKKNGLKVLELQHGITVNETPLYSGIYDKRVDPDFFLTFGDYWINDFFCIPKNKMVNIGWALKSYFKNSNVVAQKGKKKVVLISSPAITNTIVSLAYELSKIVNDVIYIRLHPQEALNIEHKNIVENNSNIVICDNKEDSFISLLHFEKVIGDNSSVLYEALSLNKPVGKLNFGKIKSRDEEKDRSLGFYLLDSFDEVLNFITSDIEVSMNKKANFVYTDFCKDKFLEIIEK